MKSQHLTDDEIQELVLNTTSQPDAINHIGECKQCGFKVAQYKILFATIKQQSKPVFDFDVTQLVMEQLSPPKAAPSKDKYITYLISSGVMFMFALLIYALKFYLRNITIKLMPVSFSLILTAALLISAFGIADMYRKFKTKMNALNYH